MNEKLLKKMKKEGLDIIIKKYKKPYKLPRGWLAKA